MLDTIVSSNDAIPGRQAAPTDQILASVAYISAGAEERKFGIEFPNQ